jgi:hypothetical protein
MMSKCEGMRRKSGARATRPDEGAWPKEASRNGCYLLCVLMRCVGGEGAVPVKEPAPSTFGASSASSVDKSPTQENYLKTEPQMSQMTQIRPFLGLSICAICVICGEIVAPGSESGVTGKRNSPRSRRSLR